MAPNYDESGPLTPAQVPGWAAEMGSNEERPALPWRRYPSADTGALTLKLNILA